ncbi:MAG: hypothetical protein CMJ18_14200 [Phycisphaeraceae bacterium]|nr:hypothetical protein [Phycisphaeraceae bacterium]
MSRAAARRRAFTLIEAIASVVILSIAVPTMTWSLAQAHEQRVNPVLTSRAEWLATEKLEQIIADRHSTTRGYSYLAVGNYPNEPAVTGFPAYSRAVTFTETTADLSTSGTGYMVVRVDVTWNDGTGTSRTMSISTVVTDYTP